MKLKATIDVETGNLFAQLDDGKRITFHNFTLRGAQEFLDTYAVADAADAVLQAAGTMQWNAKAHNHEKGEFDCEACKANLERLRKALTALEEATK